VTVTIYRPRERRSFDVKITRAQVKVESVYSRMMDDEVGYARVTKFATDTSGDLKTALLNFHRQGAKAIVLDLRYNTGGLLKEAIDVSDLFLPKGATIVSTKGKNGENNQIHKARHDPTTRLPTIVLVNGASASASEIVAAALKENDRALLMGPKGQKTFGKWSVQTIVELRNSLNYDEEGNPRVSAVRLTTAKYYSPKDHSYHKKGLDFDQEVEVSLKDEQRLIAEGLLMGDPNMIESKDTELDHFPTEDELNGTSPTLTPPQTPEAKEKPDGREERIEPEAEPRDEEPEDIEFEPEALRMEDETTSPTAAAEGPVRDVLLEEAVKMLKTHIRLMGKTAA
jgi:carboxyl-terminal processing protease